MLFVIPRYHINAHYPIDNGKSLDNIAVACKKMIDMAIDAADYKTGDHFESGRCGQAQRQSLPVRWGRWILGMIVRKSHRKYTHQKFLK